MPKITLSGPAELLTVIPFQLGFQPDRSVVVMCFHGKELGVVARLDLQTAVGDVPEDLRPTVDDAVAATLPALLRDQPSSMALIGYEHVAGESRSLLDALRDAVEQARVVVRERLVVRDGRWFDLDSPGCGPRGHPLPGREEVPAVASYIALGHAVLSGRDELARMFDPLEESAQRHDLTESAIRDWQERYVAAGGRCDGRDEGADGPDDGPEGAGDSRDGRPDGARSSPDGSRSGRDSAGRGPRLGVDPSGPDGADAGPRAGGEADLPWPLGTSLTARQFLVNDALVAWGGLLRGEFVGYGLEHWLPSLVGPLRDQVMRDAILGWLCPGQVPLDDFPDELVLALDMFVGPEVRVEPLVSTARPAPARPNESSRRDARRPRKGPRADRDPSATGSAIGSVTGGRGRGPEGPEGDPYGMAEVGGAQSADARLAERLLADGGWDDWDGWDGWDGWDDWGAAAVPRMIQSRLEQACRLTPAVHAAPLLSVTAAFAWWCGDGVRANAAVDRALELEPGHGLSRFIREALSHGLQVGPDAQSRSWTRP